ncbi:MAG: 3-phosphoshikimate 1-carboxyvinyltransferase [Blastocatellia bacterium]|nr:3-phosphoshikimate 1-carboxyvinyltransferase [Blastocatellia bacterium]
MKITPVKKIQGRVTLPGDKSISHRIALLSAIAEGVSEVSNFATSLDCHSTLHCLQTMGVEFQLSKNLLVIKGTGKNLAEPEQTLDAGNSGSTMRMLSGILAGQPFLTEITGDDSLRRRPMKRIAIPLRQMGAEIEMVSDNFAPLKIRGGNLQAIDYHMPVASAQVKTCLLLAGLYAEGMTSVTEPTPTRNHTEVMLAEFGADIRKDGSTISISGGKTLHPLQYRVPGDISSAAFLIAAALILPGSEIVIESVGLNPTRRAFIDVLQRFGASIEVVNLSHYHSEPVADLKVSYSRMKSDSKTALLDGELIANLIDEIPILALLGSQIDGGLVIRSASELRVKESDRIKSVVDGLRLMGAEVEEFSDGLSVPGPQNLKAASIDSANDHRIAMTFSIAALAATGETEILGSEIVDVSFPSFFETLSALVKA